MAALLHSEPRRLCSWLWDSHVCPKNSKWLQNNLTEMDAKVRAMLKIINEDADSFARRAEMYYKKRPELMKLVEDFYRAYRALAERCDHVTGELRLAHKTMPAAFPNQVHSMLRDDHTPSTSEPHLPAVISPHLARAFFYPDESDFGLSRKGLKQLVEMFQTGDERLRDKDSISEQYSCLSSDKNQSCIAETVMQSLNEPLVKMEAERDAVLLEYRKSLEKVSNLEKELDLAQNDIKELRKHAIEAQNEAIALKGSFEKLEADRDSGLHQYNLASKKLVSLEAAMVTFQEETTKWSDQAVKAETECQNLKLELSLYEDEKQDAIHLYEWSLEKTSIVEEKLLVAEESAKRLYEQIDLAETEIKVLKEELSRLSKEKDDACFRYHQCLYTISKIQNELMETKEDIRRLNSEIFSGSKKLTAAEDQCSELEKMNQLLRNEAKDLVQKIAERDQELFQNQTELEELMNRLQVDQSRFAQVVATLDSLQNLHFQSQEEQRALTLNLSNGLQMLKDLEVCKLEIQSLREENQELNDHMSASFVVKREMENTVLSLKEINEKLDSKLRRQADKNDAFEQQVHQLSKESDDKKYKDILQQVESAGIDPKHVWSSIEELRHKNSRLKDISREEKVEKEALLNKLGDIEEKSSILESHLSNAHTELDSSKGRMKTMQETCDSLSGEKLALVGEKSALLFKIEVFTESIQNLLKKNVSLEGSLFNANTELEGLKEKLNMLEDLECENMMQHLEIASLREANEFLDTEFDLLNEEIEACECREVILYSELNEESCDLELWEDVAVSYYFDLQESAVCEAVFESKFHELSGLCNILEDLNVRRCIEIERMKDKISFLESKNKGLETQLAAYVPVILSLKNIIASLEQNLVSHTKVHMTGTSKEQEFTVNDIPERYPPNANDKSSSVLDGLSELQDLQNQIQTIENILIAEKISIQRYKNADIEHATKMKGIEELNSGINLQPHQVFHDVEFSWSAPGTPDITDKTYTKDILLNQMLEFAENTDLKATEMNEVGNGKIILERLSSDAQELERLNLSVQELKRKIKTNKKCNSKSTKVVEYRRLSGQLQDIDGSIVHLADVNAKLMKAIEESSSSISVDSVELAKARKEAEKIGRLQLDVKKIQYLLLKLEDDKTENKKGKSRSLRSQTGANLNDFLYNHRRRNRKQKKVHMCGCGSADVLDPCIRKFVKLDN